MRKLLCILLVFSALKLAGQEDSLKINRDYSFIIQDSPALLFTMRQTNQDYLSGYRLFARALNSSVKNDYFSTMIQVVATSFILMPLTHEEGHRSVLTVNNIGSISQPYFNKHGAAYVRGVTDLTLKDLRDSDLPTYIRLHTGGLESDYMLTKRMEAIGSFGQDDYENFVWEYAMRKLGILQYYVLGLFDYDIKLEEEDNELERDIVGYDTYGAARHLYRPDMDFYRYTRFDDLTSDEKKYVDRMGYRSLLNLLNPMVVGKMNFKIGENTAINAGMGYTMAPFGDFIDENIWIKYKALNLAVYARQFQNHENWFNGFGISLVDYKPASRISMSISGHFWQQPENYEFKTAASFVGGAVDADLKIFIIDKPSALLQGLSIDLGILYKTEGFLPEELYFEEHFGIRIGTTFRL